MFTVDRYLTETTIPGGVFLAGLALVGLRIFNIEPSQTGHALKEVSPYVVVIAVIAAHVIGRIAPVLTSFATDWLWNLFRPCSP